MILASDVFLQCGLIGFFRNVFFNFFYLSRFNFVCCTVCLSVDFETAPTLASTVQGSLAGIRVCEHTDTKRSHHPAYHLLDNLLRAHQVMMTGNARLPLAWHLDYLLVSATVFHRPLFPTLLTYSLSESDLASLSIYLCLMFCLFSLFFWPDSLLLIFTHETFSCTSQPFRSLLLLFCLIFRKSYFISPSSPNSPFIVNYLL